MIADSGARRVLEGFDVAGDYHGDYLVRRDAFISIDNTNV